MHAVDGLSLSGRVELRFHDVGARRAGQVETEAASADGDEYDADARVGPEGCQGRRALGAGHAAVETSEWEVGVFEGELDEVKVGGPTREDDAKWGM